MYLIDAQGYIRYDKIGESDYDHTEMVIQFLLNERNANKGLKNMNNSNDTVSYFNNRNIIQNNTKIPLLIYSSSLLTLQKYEHLNYILETNHLVQQ